MVLVCKVANVTLTADSADISLKDAHSPASSEMMSGGIFMLPLTVSAMRDWMITGIISRNPGNDGCYRCNQSLY